MDTVFDEAWREERNRRWAEQEAEYQRRKAELADPEGLREFAELEVPQMLDPFERGDFQRFIESTQIADRLEAFLEIHGNPTVKDQKIVLPDWSEGDLGYDHSPRLSFADDTSGTNFQLALKHQMTELGDLCYPVAMKIKAQIVTESQDIKLVLPLDNERDRAIYAGARQVWNDNPPAHLNLPAKYEVPDPMVKLSAATEERFAARFDESRNHTERRELVYAAWALQEIAKQAVAWLEHVQEAKLALRGITGKVLED